MSDPRDRTGEGADTLGEVEEREGDQKREVSFGSRRSRDYLRVLRDREGHLADIINGQQAIGKASASLYWQKQERAALQWAIEQLERLDETARAEKAAVPT